MGVVSEAQFDFAGARVLVTGGTRGIGRAVAGAFADAGAAVTITGTRDSPADYDAHLAGFDYMRIHAAADAPGVADLAGLDVVVNNAGVNLPDGGDEWDPAVFDQTISANLSTTFGVSVAAHDALARSPWPGGGAVVNLASMAAFFAVPMVPAYGAAKAGIVSLTRNCAAAWAADGIRVNAVAPGVVETDMTRPMFGIPELADPQLARIALGRFGQPADIAPTILFLASASARYVTGQTWNVDGGYSSS